MGRTVRLNGGPLHGEIVTLPDNRDHIHILQPNLEDSTFQMDEEVEIQIIPLREGIYSQVFREPGEFEWDGWRSHD